MSAVTRLRAQGFDVRLTPKQSIGITPADKLPDEWRDWITANRQQVVSELQAEATNDERNEQLAERWQWFLSLADEHGIHPDVVGAEFPTVADRLDVVKPETHDDGRLRACMATLCNDLQVQDRQAAYGDSLWLPEDAVGDAIAEGETA